MKIAIVCGHFLPDMGYIEVYLAREFSNLGHEVNVITTEVVPGYVKNATSEEFQPGESINKDFGYTITRLKANWSGGQMVKAKGINKELKQYAPELVVVIGLGKLFPKPVFKRKGSYKIYTLLGDNADNYEKAGKKPLAYQLKKMVKKPVYKLAVKKSDKLFSYTPETAEIVKEIVGNRLGHFVSEKNVDISLGFDPTKFYCNETERKAKREELDIADEAKVLITATRIIPHKRLENVIDHVDAINESGVDLHYILVGFFEDAYGSEVRQYVLSKKHARKIHMFPFLPHDEVRALYNAADVAYFPTAVISIFEAMGTGLPVILPPRMNVRHIVRDNNGWYIQGDDLKSTLQQSLESIDPTKKENRKSLADYNQSTFSYPVIAKKILG